MKRIVRILCSHKELSLNWFRAKKKISGGIVEGFNNRAKIDYQKSLWFSNIRSSSSRPLSHAWGITRIENDPQILLRRL